MDDDETLINQLKDDIQENFKNYSEYLDLVVKNSQQGDTEISYPLVIISELNNSYDIRYYDLKEHVIDVGYQFTILAEQSETLDAETNVRTIKTIIKRYMCGEKYHALEMSDTQQIASHPHDANVKIGYLRYTGCIDKDTHTIYRRN